MIVSARAITRGGAYLVRRARTLAARLAKKSGSGSAHEVIDTYLIRAIKAGKIATGTVIDPPTGLVMTGPLGEHEIPVTHSYKMREWYDTREAPDTEEVSRADLVAGSYLVSRAFYDTPSAPFTTGPGAMFPGGAMPWAGAGIESRHAIRYAMAVIDSRGGTATFIEAIPFGIPFSQPYGVQALLYTGQSAPLFVQITQRYLAAEIAASGWHFGPHKGKPVDVRAGWPVDRIAQFSGARRDFVMVASTFQHETLTGLPALLTSPAPGICLLAHSQAKLVESINESMENDGTLDGARFEDGLLWHTHYELRELFPVLETGPYLCAPRYNNDYSLNGAGNPANGSEAFKIWKNGFYTDGVPPVNIGKLPCFLTRLCVDATDEEILVLAGVTWTTCADWNAIDPVDVDAPLEQSQLFCCNGLIRLRFDHEGALLSSSLSSVDSTAGPDQLEFDGLPEDGRSSDASLFAQPVAQLIVRGQPLEIISEWVESRRNDRAFSVTPWLGSQGSVDFALSGTRVNFEGETYFFSVEESGIFTWSRLEAHAGIGHLIHREYPESEAPSAVQLSPTQIGFVGYKLVPYGRMVFCVVDLLTGALDIRGEIGRAGFVWSYLPPHPRGDRAVTGNEKPQGPPTLSVAQQLIQKDGEPPIEGVLLCSFSPQFSYSLISKDSGMTWDRHVIGASSPRGVFFVPNALHANYETGTAVAAPPVDEDL